MAKVKWLGCVIMPPWGRTLIHTYPIGEGEPHDRVAAYRLTLFGRSIESQGVVLEGVELRKPEGFWLDELFSFDCTQGAVPSWCGLLLEFLPSTRTVELEKSQSILEVTNGGGQGSAKFRPVRVAKKGSLTFNPVPVLRQSAASLLVVNGSESPHKVSFEGSVALARPPTPFGGREVRPRSVQEFPLERRRLPLQLNRSLSYIQRTGASTQEVAYYLVSKAQGSSQLLGVAGV